jgi:hypothetical protein
MHQENFNQNPGRMRLKYTRVFYGTPVHIFSLIATAVILFFSFSLFPQNVSAYGPYDNPAPVDIGSAIDFTVIGKTGITSDNLTTFGGNIGVSPAAAAALTSVTCANMTAGRMYTITAPASPTGCITTASTTSADNAKLSAATADFGAAYIDARNQATHPYDETAGAINIGIGVKGRGIYRYTGATSMDTDLVLRGSSTDIWIFQINGEKTQAATVNVVLQNEAGVVDGANGPRARNIFWAVDGAANQGANTHFVGVVMATGALALGSGSTFVGRGFSDGTVSVATSAFSTPAEIQEQTTLVTVGQTITGSTFFSSPSFAPLSTTGGSGAGAVSFAVTTAGTAGCSIVGTSTLLYSSGGTCTVTATKADDTDYYEATSTPATFTVILGTEATAITNQGAGTYTFTVASGTLNADYYSFRNLDALGLQLIGNPTVSSLSHGDFQQAGNGTTLITLASTTLNINAPLTVTNTRFSTGGFSPGVNVSLDATSTNIWSFSGLFGNLWGEAFDVDGIDTCGSVLWDDSSCPLTKQAGYRWRNDDGAEGATPGTWYDSDWGKRTRVRVVNNDATTYTNVAVKLDVTYDADMQTNFEDIRFTDSTGTALVGHWLERFTSATQADVWVQIPTLPTSGVTEIYMYYDNAFATSESDASNVFSAFEDFESNDISNYSGDTALFATGGTYAFGGDYGLDASPDTSAVATDGISSSTVTFSQGEIIRYMQYVNTAGSADEACMMFAVQGSVEDNINYGVCLQQLGTDRVSLVENVVNTDTSGTLLASADIDFSSLGSGWYEVEIDWQTNDTIDVFVFDSGGTLLATISAIDATHTSGDLGFTFWFQNGGWDSIVSYPRVDTKPTSYFGVEQVDGGASWAAAQSVVTSSFSIGETARLRVGIENTGLPIANKNFRLEYAAKLTAPSCGAVSDGSFAQVPVAASCGSSALCMTTSADVTDGDPTTDHLATGDLQFTAGEIVADTSNETSNFDMSQNEYTEIEYVINLTVNAEDEAYCFRVTDGGTALESYSLLPELTIAYTPTLSAVSLNNGLDITLIPGTTTTIVASSTVTDFNGVADLAAVTTTFYKTSVGAACTPDDNNCYVATSSCSFINCTDNSCSLICTAPFAYHTDATDTDGAQEWFAFMEVNDQAGSLGIGTSIGVELLTLRALDVQNAIAYGTVDVNDDTAALNPSVSLLNFGNESIDVQISGTDMTNGYGSTIPAAQQRYATSTFNYSSCIGCTTLSVTGDSVEVDLLKPTVSTPLIQDEIYWGIAIPFGTASSPHTGINFFMAITD